MKQKAELEHQEKDYVNKLYETKKKATTIESERRSRMSNLEHQTEIKMQIGEDIMLARLVLLELEWSYFLAVRSNGLSTSSMSDFMELYLL